MSLSLVTRTAESLCFRAETVDITNTPVLLIIHTQGFAVRIYSTCVVIVIQKIQRDVGLKKKTMYRTKYRICVVLSFAVGYVFEISNIILWELTL